MLLIGHAATQRTRKHIMDPVMRRGDNLGGVTIWDGFNILLYLVTPSHDCEFNILLYLVTPPHDCGFNILLYLVTPSHDGVHFRSSRINIRRRNNFTTFRSFQNQISLFIKIRKNSRNFFFPIFYINFFIKAKSLSQPEFADSSKTKI